MMLSILEQSINAIPSFGDMPRKTSIKMLAVQLLSTSATRPGVVLAAASVVVSHRLLSIDAIEIDTAID